MTTPSPQSEEAQEREFEAHLLQATWHQVMVQAKDDDDEGASIYRMCRMAAREAWTARASLPSAAASGEASAVQEAEAGWAALIHYPKHWDTTAYPTLESAVSEALSWAGCSACKDPKAYGIDDATPAVEGLTAEALIESSFGKWRAYDYEDVVQIVKAALAASPVPMASSAGEPVTTGVLPLPVGIPTYDRLGNQTKAHYTADQMHEYSARCMLHAIPSAASLREQEDAKAVIYELIGANERWGLTTRRAKAVEAAYALIERIDAQRLGRGKE